MSEIKLAVLTPADARKMAAGLVRTQLGLPESPSAWTYEQRVVYNKALAAYIAANPHLFEDRDLLTADLVSKQAYPALADDSFDVGAFVHETVKPAAEAARAIGDGVFSVANAARWAVPAAAAVLVVMVLIHANRKLAAA